MELNKKSGELELLLSRFDDGAPTLDGGFSLEDASKAPRPTDLELFPRMAAEPFLDPGENPNDLPSQRWGVIYPKGSRLFEAIRPLVEWRAQGQGATPRAWAVGPEVAGSGVRKWIQQVLLPSVSEKELPRYLLILGDLEQVRFELQQVLSIRHFTGRLAFSRPNGTPDLEAYEAYVDKLIRFEDPARTPPVTRSRALCFTVHDGSRATYSGYETLMKPAALKAREAFKRGEFPVMLEEHGRPSPSPDELLELVGNTTPTVLLSLSHGAGAPARGWSNEAEQRRFQGAMSFGKQGGQLTAEDVASRPFLPGGFWFYFACFGLGTPSQSAYWHWLRSLSGGSSYPVDPAIALSSLPTGGRPFLAALPQALLANPQGPLGVMGHIDLAWSYSYEDGPGGIGHAERFLRIPNQLAMARRAGLAFGQLIDDLGDTNDRLLREYDDDERDRQQSLAREREVARRAWLASHDPGEIDSEFEYDEDEVERAHLSGQPVDRQRGHLWMVRQDLSNYLLLGDPAARLPVGGPTQNGQKDTFAKKTVARDLSGPVGDVRTKETTAEGEPPSSNEAPSMASWSQDAGAARNPMPVDDASIERWEEAIVAWLYGEEGRKAIARRLGVPMESLEAAVRIYRDAGRERLQMLGLRKSD